MLVIQTQQMSTLISQSSVETGKYDFDIWFWTKSYKMYSSEKSDSPDCFKNYVHNFVFRKSYRFGTW